MRSLWSRECPKPRTEREYVGWVWHQHDDFDCQRTPRRESTLTHLCESREEVVLQPVPIVSPTGMSRLSSRPTLRYSARWSAASAAQISVRPGAGSAPRESLMI